MEPLEEAVYLDQVRLLAVDHPADLDVYPNEYFAVESAIPGIQSCRQPRCAARLPEPGTNTATTFCPICSRIVSLAISK